MVNINSLQLLHCPFCNFLFACVNYCTPFPLLALLFSFLDFASHKSFPFLSQVSPVVRLFMYCSHLSYSCFHISCTKVAIGLSVFSFSTHKFIYFFGFRVWLMWAGGTQKQYCCTNLWTLEIGAACICPCFFFNYVTVSDVALLNLIYPRDKTWVLSLLLPFNQFRAKVLIFLIHSLICRIGLCFVQLTCKIVYL